MSCYSLNKKLYKCTREKMFTDFSFLLYGVVTRPKDGLDVEMLARTQGHNFYEITKIAWVTSKKSQTYSHSWQQLDIQRWEWYVIENPARTQTITWPLGYLLFFLWLRIHLFAIQNYIPINFAVPPALGPLCLPNRCQIYNAHIQLAHSNVEHGSDQPGILFLSAT